MTQNIRLEPSTAAKLTLARTAVTPSSTRRWEVHPSSSMQRASAGRRSAVHILGGAFTATAEPERAELRVDLAVDSGAMGPSTLELVSRSIERGPDGSLRFTMCGALTVDGESIATEMVLRDCTAHELHIDEWASLSGATVTSPHRRRTRESMSLDLLLVPVITDRTASRAYAA